MACPENTRQIPVNIKTSSITQYAKNLSKFTYDFKKATKVKVSNPDNDVKGVGIMEFSGMQNSHINFSTMGDLRLLGSYLFLKSVNKYNGSRADLELMMVFLNNSGEYLNMFIPVKVNETKSSSSRFFDQIFPVLEDRDDMSSSYLNEITVTNVNVNDLIPRDSFLYYNAVFAPVTGCSMKINMIFYNKMSNISSSSYNAIKAILGTFSDNNMTSDATKGFLNLSNYEKMHTINWRLMYINVKGTKDGPGRKSPDVLPLTCTPILDEEDKPIEGTRLDWIKQGFDGLSGEFKNFLFVAILIIVVVGLIVTAHEFAFKYIGRLIGNEKTLTRSKVE